MTKLTSDFFVERLRAWGVTRIYGYPGDGINGVLGALQRVEGTEDGIEFIQVRHEEMAGCCQSNANQSPPDARRSPRLAA